MWLDTCPRTDAGKCVWVGLRMLLGAACPSIEELDSCIRPVFEARRRTESDLTVEDCGRPGDTWCMAVVERALRSKHRAALIFECAKRGDIYRSPKPLLVIGTLNRKCGFVDDGEPDAEWCHAVAVMERRIYDNNLDEKGWPIHRLLGGEVPYLTRVIRVYHIAVRSAAEVQRRREAQRASQTRPCKAKKRAGQEKRQQGEEESKAGESKAAAPAAGSAVRTPKSPRAFELIDATGSEYHGAYVPKDPDQPEGKVRFSLVFRTIKTMAEHTSVTRKKLQGYLAQPKPASTKRPAPFEEPEHAPQKRHRTC